MSIEPITEWGPRNHRPAESTAGTTSPASGTPTSATGELDRPDDN